jgi:hypothetical protein
MNEAQKNGIPTPFGWVLVGADFDLNTVISFRNQLLALSKACNSGVGSVAPAPEPIGVSHEISEPSVVETLKR